MLIYIFEYDKAILRNCTRDEVHRYLILESFCLEIG